MPETCWSSVRGKVARLTQTDDCCRPVAGPCGTIVTDGFVTVSYSPEIEEGEEILVKKANGAICVNDKSCDTLKRVNVEIEFCQVSPSIFARMTGNPVVTDHAGNPVGNRIGETVRCDIGFALEVWSDVPGARCSVTGVPQYGYFLVPCLTGGTIQDFTIENDAATFTVTGYSRPAQGWGRGPYDVDGQDAANTPGPLLTPFGQEEHMDMHLTTVPPPAAACQCEELVLPASYTTDTDGGGTPDNYDTDPNDPNVGDSSTAAAPFAADFPATPEAYERSEDGGATYTAGPAASEAAPDPSDGTNGQERYRTTYTIPAGVTGTYTITLGGDVDSGQPGSTASLDLDGVALGGVGTYTVNATPGAHTLTLLVGASNGAGDVTAPSITFDYTGARQSA